MVYFVVVILNVLQVAAKEKSVAPRRYENQDTILSIDRRSTITPTLRITIPDVHKIALE